MNNTGQAMIYGVMMFALAFIAATLMLHPLMDVGDTARTDLGCDDDGKSQGTYLVCTAIDLFPFFLYVCVLSAAAGIIVSMSGKEGG